MQFEAVIFDFDGLMIESERIALRVWKEVVAALGSHMEDEVNRLLIGKSPDTGVAIVRDHLQLTIPKEELRDMYWEQRTTEMCLEAEPVNDLEALIQYLSEADIRLGVASNSPTFYVERVLEAIQLRGYFECVVGSDQAKQAKPAPDIYLETAKRLRIDPGKILALEDSPTGIEAAVQAGMTCYAIPNPDLFGEDFNLAHQVFPSMSTLHRALKNTHEV